MLHIPILRRGQVYRSLEQDPRWRVYLTLSEQ